MIKFYLLDCRLSYSCTDDTTNIIDYISHPSLYAVIVCKVIRTGPSLQEAESPIERATSNPHL